MCCLFLSCSTPGLSLATACQDYTRFPTYVLPNPGLFIDSYSGSSQSDGLDGRSIVLGIMTFLLASEYGDDLFNCLCLILIPQMGHADFSSEPHPSMGVH